MICMLSRVAGLPAPSRPDVRYGPPGPSLTRRWLRCGILPALATYAGSTVRATPREIRSQKKGRNVRTGSWVVAGLVLIVALGMHTCLEAAPVVLVEEGQPRATIVVPAEASPTVRRAADEVRGYLEQMSGARLPIAAEGDAVAGMRIDVGLTELTRGRLPEGFAGDPERVWIETHDRGVAACGGGDRGTLFAVFRLLEVLGCRWLTADPADEIVPRRDTVTIESLRVDTRPAFTWRLFGAGSERWGLKLGLNGIYSSESVGTNGGCFSWPRQVRGVHAYHQIVPAEKYAAMHPEWSPLGGGMRRPTELFCQLCLTAPGLADEFAANVIAAFDAAVTRRVAAVARTFRYGFSMIDWLEELARFEATGDWSRLADAQAAGRKAMTYGLPPEGVVPALGVLSAGFGREEIKGGRACWNADETGPGDKAGGYAQFFIPGADPREPLLVELDVWGESDLTAIHIETAMGRWTRVAPEQPLSRLPEWDTLRFRIPPDFLAADQASQHIGFGGGDSQVWVAAIRVGESPPAATDAEEEEEEEWKLIWSDEFDTPQLDPKKWGRCERGKSDWNDTMSDDPGLVEWHDGVLHLRGIANPDTEKTPPPFLTAGITSKGKFQFRYGKVEIRARFKSARGAWPALWLLVADGQTAGYGEIDLMEHLNFEDKVYQTIHTVSTPAPGGKQGQPRGTSVPIDRDGWNTYGAEWDADQIVFTVNGTPTMTYRKLPEAGPAQWPFDQEFYLIMSMQIGGKWVGEADPADYPAGMDIDWIRVHQRQR